VSRDARTRPAGNRAATARRSAEGAPARRSGAPRPGAGQQAPPPSDSLVVGPVPRSSRVVGGLLLVAALAGVAASFPTYLVVGGQELSSSTGVGSLLVALLVPMAHVAMGVLLVRGALPKLGLAYAALSGALAVGQLLIEIYRGRSSTTRPAVEVLAGERVLTSSIEPAAGWALGLVALGVTVLAGVVAAAAWGRTVMEDGGALDAVRPGLGGAAVLLGVATVLSLSLPAADVPDQLRRDPITGLETVVTMEGPQALLERPGLALLGGLLLAGAVVLCSVIAPSLRPRLGAVGGLLAIAVVVLSVGLTGLRDAASPDLEWTLPGAGLLLTGLGYTALTVLAWRLRRGSR
jgi:hypothetical protein